MSGKYVIVGVLLITLVVFRGCGSTPEANEWRTSTITESGTVDDFPMGSLLVGDPKQIGKDVQIHMIDTLREKAECRIVAIVKKGKTRIGEGNVRFGRSADYRSTVAVFPDTNLEDIREFQFQTRPWPKETGRMAEKSQLSNAVKKRRMVDEVCDNNLFVSKSVN